MSRFLAVLLFAALAGCTGPAAPVPTETTTPPAPEPSGPAVAVEDCVQFSICYEPTVAVDPQGRIFVSDGSTSAIGVSEDGGATFRQVPPPPIRNALGEGQADVLLQVAPSGRLYYSALIADVGPAPLLLGIQVAWSDDGAATWAGNVAVDPQAIPATPVLYPDRQWLGFGAEEEVYLTYNQIPSGIWLARSTDGGATWGGWVRAAPPEARAGGIGQSGPPVVDANGTVLVAACQGTGLETVIFRSTDAGATFTSTTVAAGCNWFPILAVDGSRVVLAVQNGDVRVAVSTDGGSTFSDVVRWGSRGTVSPWPVPTPDGGLALAWYKAIDDTNAELHVSHGSDAGPDADVVVAKGVPALTDFASAALMPDGSLVVVWVVKDQTMAQIVPVPERSA